MEEQIEYARRLVKEGKVSLVSKEKNIVLDVAGHIVRIFTKKGRRLITVDCKNDTRFCNEPTIDVFKLAAIYYLMTNKRNNFLNKLLERYEKDVELGLPTETFAILDELKTLRRMI